MPTLTKDCAEGRHSKCEFDDCSCHCHPVAHCPPHNPHHLGMIISGSSPTGLVVNRVHVRLCVKCGAVYWEELPSLTLEGQILGGNN